MSWQIRHEGSPRALEGLTLPDIVQGLQDGAWEPTDEVRGPGDNRWVAIENHPQLAEVAELKARRALALATGVAGTMQVGDETFHLEVSSPGTYYPMLQSALGEIASMAGGGAVANAARVAAQQIGAAGTGDHRATFPALRRAVLEQA